MMTAHKAMLTTREVAALVGSHEITVQRAVKAGKLASYRLGPRMVRFRPEDVNRWLESTRYQAAA
jgi:excisionase family DNA binding protein